MVIVVRSQRTSVYVPVLLLTFTAAMAVTSSFGCLARPSWGALLSVVVTLGLFVLVLSMGNACRASERTIRRWSLFARGEVVLVASAVAFTVESGGRGGVEYPVLADDGFRRIELARAWTRRGAARDVRRLREGFGIDDSPAREPGRQRLARDLAAWHTSQAQARALIRSYSEGRGFWKTAAFSLGVVLVVFGGVAVAVLLGQ